ncbi:MAG: TlyA family RNA methyltransferase [Clostridiales bacterium]|nr:TlyA family RNA methyltransferase [Clostridiales bacterium]
MKERLDLLLVQRKLAKSREKAKVIIQSGNVYVNGRVVDKAGSMFEEDAIIEIKDNPLKYVSRGGLKLEKALNSFSISLEGRICMDVGASTGGFTDCMLQRGAKKVYAVDVGSDQLDSALKEDVRVVSMEKTNIRYLTPEQIKDDISFISVDVSFISLTKVLDAIWRLLHEQGELVALIKPQFEVGAENLGKRGVVKDKKAHINAIKSVSCYAISLGFFCMGLDYSPIRGPEGNIEYLMHLIKGSSSVRENDCLWISSQNLQELVDKAHSSLK